MRIRSNIIGKGILCEVSIVNGPDTLTVPPYQLADLADNDNNVDLCAKESGVPILVRVK